MSSIEKILKYATIVISLKSLIVALYCIYDEIINDLAMSDTTKVISCICSTLHAIVSVLLAPGALLRKPFLILPWIVLLPVTIFDYIQFVRSILNDSWGIVLALIVAIGSWYVAAHLYIMFRRLDDQRQRRTIMANFGAE
ncbi:uncharacterized protein LOC116805917 [Drosophila grimshawi]|uniref:uncharacterized protein LOC116805917 n=1 Tax=Drosophila grimshawi TaxID=7222 RepID=UPI000C87116C|nr:uncharacterized protein LOC116805917 [Drosophila grimshawi]